MDFMLFFCFRLSKSRMFDIFLYVLFVLVVIGYIAKKVEKKAQRQNQFILLNATYHKR
jgi:cytochrome c oxidase assembly factor CtaG